MRFMDMTPEQWAEVLDAKAAENRKITAKQRAEVRARERAARLLVLREFFGEKGKAARAEAAAVTLAGIENDTRVIRLSAHAAIDQKWADFKRSLEPEKRRLRKAIKLRLAA